MISARLRRNSRSRRRGSSHAMPALIPMIDMLTILVVYLLVHAADYEILPNTKQIQIPQSLSETKPRETVTLLITRETIFVNGVALASVAQVQSGDNPIIEPLRAVCARGGKGAAPRLLCAEQEVTVLADKDLRPVPEEDPVDLHRRRYARFARVLEKDRLTADAVWATT